MTFIIPIPTNNKRKRKLEDTHDELKSLLGHSGAGLVVTDSIEYIQEP